MQSTITNSIAGNHEVPMVLNELFTSNVKVFKIILMISKININ